MNSFFRFVSFAVSGAVFNMSIPFGLADMVGLPIKQKVDGYLAAREFERKSHFKSRPIGLADQERIYGKQSECPYIAGSAKWDVPYKGVNLLNGNYSTSVTDISFDGGYGIPVNITRSYSSNDASEGPFGKGWELSADTRSTAGGLLKGASAPVRSVPSTFKERNTAELDPNIATQPAAAVTATDASGKPETIQKDIDGVLTTPPWDNNVSNPTYGYVTFGGSTYQVQTGNITTTLDGTVYTYVTEGSYPAGTKPYNNSSAAAQPANVLKVTQAVDRQGNPTTYGYDPAAWVTFTKLDGQTQEHPLISVSMPGGHVLTIKWGYTDSTCHVTGGGALIPNNRINSISDGARTVCYAYDGSGNLLKAMSPGGRITTYGYGAAANPSSLPNPSLDLLTSITDCRGLTTYIAYIMSDVMVAPYENYLSEAPLVLSVTAPNGNFTRFGISTAGGTYETSYFADFTSSSMGTMLNQGTVQTQVVGGVFAVQMLNPGVIFTEDPIGHLAPYWEKDYDPSSENLMKEIDYTYVPYQGPTIDQIHHLNVSGPPWWTVTTQNTYNFGGNPLSKSVTEHYGSGSPTDFIYTTSYAYWDGSKYFQLKATKDQAGRYTYTDYYPNTAAAGSRGQKYEVFDPAHGGFTFPGGPPVGDQWKYEITPAAGQYSGQFAYDSKGRCTDVYKLQKAVGPSSSWTYVHTLTAYGADGGGLSGTWGQASQVTEDVGGANRTTQTHTYTSWGKPCDVIDGAGHEFFTSFDADGNELSITKTAPGTSQTLVSYTYGTSGVSNGMPTDISDGITGVTDHIDYVPAYLPGGPPYIPASGAGSPLDTVETNGAMTYSVTYSYDSAGDRAQAQYITPNGVQTWGYFDYVRSGSPDSGKRIFHTLNKMASTGARTSEEMHYAYDTSGALYAAAFAQTPQTGQTDYSNAAQDRCRVIISRDPGGRTTDVAHWWDTWGGTSYSSAPVLDNTCGYEVNMASNRGLKLTSAFTTGTGPTRTESFSYDPSLDYLTGANYGDGLPAATWSYDAAGNRSDTVTDNLNRPTSINGVTTTSDLVGNRLSLGSLTYGWDVVNRLISYGSVATYAYRADGMRVSKTVSGTTTKYFYDGQMGVEDQEGTSAVTDYGLGSRGIDYIAKTSGGTTTVGFPLYDAHGNMTACLFRSGTSFSLGNQRSFDAWGLIRQGTTTGDPKGRYCASLGHKQDDESGLVYMRARYYEPSSGRFLNRDLCGSGLNWYVYCGDDPVGRVDISGQNAQFVNSLGGIGMLLWCTAVLLAALNRVEAAMVASEMAMVFLVAAVADSDIFNNSHEMAVMHGIAMELTWIAARVRLFKGIKEGEEFGGPATTAVLALGLYVLTVMAVMIANQAEEQE